MLLLLHQLLVFVLFRVVVSSVSLQAGLLHLLTVSPRIANSSQLTKIKLILFIMLFVLMLLILFLNNI